LKSSKFAAVFSFLISISGVNANTISAVNNSGDGLSTKEKQVLIKMFQKGLITLNPDTESFDISPNFVDTLIESGDIRVEDIQIASDCISICGGREK
jgi:hypothetical protein